MAEIPGSLTHSAKALVKKYGDVRTAADHARAEATLLASEHLKTHWRDQDRSPCEEAIVMFDLARELQSTIK